MFQKIMVAYDDSPEAGRALTTGIELAKMMQAELSVVTVLTPPPSYYAYAVSALPAIRWTDEHRAKFSALQEEARTQACAAGVEFSAELISGDEISCIVDCTKQHHTDLLIMGMRRQRLLAHHTTKEVMERAPCALLGIR